MISFSFVHIVLVAFSDMKNCFKLAWQRLNTLVLPFLHSWIYGIVRYNRSKCCQCCASQLWSGESRGRGRGPGRWRQQWSCIEVRDGTRNYLVPIEVRDGTIDTYLIPRLSLKVVYLWRHVSSTAPPFILWWWNLETLFAPLNDVTICDGASNDVIVLR
jgi:hypothetical protein